jgi:hypothetical protein
MTRGAAVEPSAESVEPAVSAAPAVVVAQDSREGCRGGQIFTRAARGYRLSRPVEQSTFLMTVTFAVTIAGARAITYVMERRRSVPVVRGLTRALPRLPGSNDIRIHHYLPGMVLTAVAGGASILASGPRVGPLLSVPFGVGVALTADEIGLLIERNNPYWGTERAVALQWLAATGLSVVMAGVLVRRGAPQRHMS